MKKDDDIENFFKEAIEPLSSMNKTHVQTIAQVNYLMYAAHVQAGFTSTQAFDLMMFYLQMTLNK